MDRLWKNVLFFIIVFAIGVLVGLFLQTGREPSSGRAAPNVRCTITYTHLDESTPDAWAAEPFRVWPIEHGIYYVEPDEKERHDTEL